MSEVNLDEIRLDRLSDPTFEFHYALGANGVCKISHPRSCVTNNLRLGIDWARSEQNEIPKCIQCHTAINELHREIDGLTYRWTCPHCKTSFLWNYQNSPIPSQTPK